MDLGEILGMDTVRKFRRLFYEYTGMATSFSFPGWKRGQVDFFPRTAKCEFCRIIQRLPEGRAACRRSDERMTDLLVRKAKPLVTSCHAGISGVAAPVFFNGECQGAVLAGDVLTRKPTKADFQVIRKKLDGFGIDFEELEKAYYKMPVMSHRAIRLALETLSLIVSYIVNREEIISLQESVYEKQRELSDAVMARVETEKGLRRKMDELDSLRERLLAAQRRDGVAVLTDDHDSRRKRVAGEALSFVDQYYATEITLKDVAEHVRLSPNYLSALFHQECGFTLKDYIVGKRIETACALLQDLGLNVSEAGIRVGYSNLSHFNRMFKKIVGITPGEYRNRIVR